MVIAVDVVNDPSEDDRPALEHRLEAYDGFKRYPQGVSSRGVKEESRVTEFEPSIANALKSRDVRKARPVHEDPLEMAVMRLDSNVPVPVSEVPWRVR